MYVIYWHRIQTDGATLLTGIVGPFSKIVDAEEYAAEYQPKGTAATILQLQEPVTRITRAPR